MKHDNLGVAQRHLRAAHTALIAELEQADSYPVQDAANLTEDALSQVRGEIRNRLPMRYDWLGGAA